jgi:hypothetical protein
VFLYGLMNKAGGTDHLKFNHPFVPAESCQGEDLLGLFPDRIHRPEKDPVEFTFLSIMLLMKKSREQGDQRGQRRLQVMSKLVDKIIFLFQKPVYFKGPLPDTII